MNIATAIKAQLLGQLIDALSKPAAPLGTQSSLAQALQTGALKTGGTVEARVLSANADGTLTLALGQQQLTARVDGAALPPGARQPGTVLTLNVAGIEQGAEPRLSFISAAAPTAPARTAPGAALPQQPSPAAQRQTAISDAVAQSAARQGSAAPLFADLAALTTRPSGAPLSTAVLALANALLSTRLDGDQPITAEALKLALQATGVLHEANSARSGAPVLDAKALLTLLKAALEPRQTAALRADASRPDAPAARQDLTRLDLTRQDISRAEPPRPDGPVAAHKPSLASLATEPRAEVITAALAREVGEATDRLRLHQLASLPEAQHKTDLARQLNMELPIALGQQTALAGFRVERDRRRRAASGETVDSWGIRFAIDADGIGPVHAHLRLQGTTISVSLWAEDAGTHRLFVDALPRLEAALRDGALDVQDLMVFAGRPSEAPKRAQGTFLDRSS